MSDKPGTTKENTRKTVTNTEDRSNNEEGHVVRDKGSNYRLFLVQEAANVPTRPPPMDYEDMFNLSGHGAFNYWALVATSLFLWYSAIESLSMAYVITPIECDLTLSVPERGLIGSGCYIGLVFTALCWGGISDRYGRKKVIVPTVILCIAFSFISSISRNFWTMFIFRLLVGMMLSASFSTVLVYLGEVTTSAYRDKIMSWAITISVTQYIFIPALAWILIPGTWYFNIGDMIIRPWRVFMWMWGLVGGTAVLIILFMPESPRFLYATKGIRVALPAVAHIFAVNHKKNKEDFPAVTLAASSTTIVDIQAKSFRESVHHMALLLRKPMLMPMLISHYCMFIVHLTVFGMYMWLPDIFHETMQDLSRKISMCDVIVIKYGKNETAMAASRYSVGGGGGDCGGMSGDMYPMSMLAEFVFMLPYFLLSMLIHRISKIRIYSVTLGVAQILFVMSGFIRQPVLSMILIIIGTASSASAILTAMAEEIFPTTLRATAMCTMYMAGEFGTVLGTNLMPACALSLQWCWGVFIVIALANLLSCLWIELGWPNVEHVRRIMEDKGFPY